MPGVEPPLMPINKQLQSSASFVHPSPSVHDNMQAELTASMPELGMHPIVHLEPFYGDPAHAPERPPVFAGLEFRVPVDSIASLPAFSHTGPGRLEALCAARVSLWLLWPACPAAQAGSSFVTHASLWLSVGGVVTLRIDMGLSAVQMRPALD